MGANGCGKSTLYEPSGLLRPAKGSRVAAGKTAGLQARTTGLRQQVATVFQDPEQQIFIPISIKMLRLVYVLGVPEAEITRRVDEALTLADSTFRHISPFSV